MIRENQRRRADKLRENILDFLSRSDRPLSVKEIARRFRISPSLIRYHLDVLNARGTIQQFKDDSDRRKTWLYSKI